jgi:hypothetical protein
MNKNIDYLPVATPLHKEDDNEKKVIEIILSTNRDIQVACPEEQNNSPEMLAATFNNDNLYKYFCLFFPFFFIIIIVIIYYSGLF